MKSGGDSARWLSPRVVVGITGTGLGIPRTRLATDGASGVDTLEWQPITPRGLALLTFLAAGTDLSDDGLRARFDGPKLVELLDHLLDDGLLVDEAPGSADAADPRSVRERSLGGDAGETEAAEPSDHARLVLDTPVLLSPRPGGFLLAGRLDGRATDAVLLRPFEVQLLASFRRATEPAPVIEASPVKPERAWALVNFALDAGLLEPQADRVARRQAHSRNQLRLTGNPHADHPSPLRGLDSAAADSGGRIPVFGVWYDLLNIPLALGLVYSAMEALGRPALAEVFDLTPRFVQPSLDLDELPSGPAVYLFSDYVWNTHELLAVCAAIKARNPEAIMVHGGPNVPKYPLDTRRFFADNPSVDVAVIGEGELTAADLMSTLAEAYRESGTFDVSCLESVAGLAYRRADGSAARGPDRDRMEDPNEVPSPYLSGVFDSILPSYAGPIIETNRGCPYKCTFCDWGSATNSRIRMYDEERVNGEIRFVGENQLRGIFIADANFGIRKRDIDFARQIADTRREFGFPREFTTNYAKNTVKYLREIIEVLVEVDILTTGTVSLQSMDETTLAAIERSNIKTAKYDELTAEFREHDLPVNVHLMIGLPGQTPESMAEDLQQCMDREITAHVYETELLLNSPMNDPEYRQRFEIGTEAIVSDFNILQGAPQRRELVVSSASFTRDDYRYMGQLRLMYILSETFGVFRHVLRYLRRHAGVREVDAMRRMLALILESPDTYPNLATAYELTHLLMVPPVSWPELMAEVEDLVRAEWPDGDYSGLETTIRAQLAVLPAFGREFPYTVELDHDFAGWFALVRDAKIGFGPGDWVDHVPALAELGPATLVVEDPRGVNRAQVGNVAVGPTIRSWELQSAIRRPAFD